MLARLLRFLFVPADRLRPKAWWCPGCQEAHYAAMPYLRWKQ